MKTTEYWLAEMTRIEDQINDSAFIADHAEIINSHHLSRFFWNELRDAMLAAIREEQQTATHEALLASARDAVDRDLERAGWRGVLAYVGTALDRYVAQGDHQDDPEIVCGALGQLSQLAGCDGRHRTCHSTCMCLTCPHAEWPDSPATGKTDTREHNPSPEGQTTNTGEFGAVGEDLRDQLKAARQGVDYFYGRMREESARREKVEARRDKWRARFEAAEDALANHIADAGKMVEGED